MARKYTIGVIIDPNLKMYGSFSLFTIVINTYMNQTNMMIRLANPGIITDGLIMKFDSLNLISAIKISSKMAIRDPRVIPIYAGL